MRQIDTVIDIDAPARQVWQVLTDFRSYRTWNPFIVDAEGEAVQGARIAITIAAGNRRVKLRPVVQVAARERELRWIGHWIVPGLLDGEHSFRLEQRRESCRLHNAERFTGLLLRRFTDELVEATRQGFIAMNRALKERAEDQ